MPRFEVRISTSYQFDAKDKAEAKRLVERGEMPSDHEIIGVRLEEVSRVVTEEELKVEQATIERTIQLSMVKACLDQ